MSDAGSRRYSGREILLGVLFVASLAGLAFLAAKYSKNAGFWKKRQQIFVVFENVGSLTQDAPVRYNGLEIGHVKTLRPVHLDEKLMGDKFRILTRRDINNLPIPTDALKRQLLELPPERFDKACRQELAGTTMIELCLEVLNDNDPIRYRLDDEVRIVSTVFGDSAVEIVSGSGPVNDVPNQYVIGNSGDFFSNLQNSMSEVKDILTGVKDIVGNDERKSFARAQHRYASEIGIWWYRPGLNARIAALNRTAAERTKQTLKRYNDLTTTAQDKLAETGKVLEGLQPAAQAATDSMQAALKDIEERIQEARGEAGATMTDIARDFTDTQEAIRIPIRQVRLGIDQVKGGMIAAKTDVERAPARIDAALDAAGSMQTQSSDDLERSAIAAKKSIANLKITAFVAKENKDLMVSTRDNGEHFAQTSLDIHRKLGAASRRMLNAGSDVLDAARDLESDLTADPVIGRAENAAQKLRELRAPVEAVREALDAAIAPAWTARKRAAWHGDGLPRY